MPGCTEAAAPATAYPRLSHRQWATTVKDLLFLPAAPDTTMFSNDAPSVTGFDNNGGQLVVSPGLRTDYEEAAEKLAADIAADPARLALLFPAGTPASGAARARAFVTSFGERAFRRPLSTTEVELFATLYQAGPSLIAGSDETAGGVQITLSAMLQSPQFVYRVEDAGQRGIDGAYLLTDYEVASRLSFALWDSMPDDVLLAAAKIGQLRTPAELAAQAERMLKDPRSAVKLDEFHNQLLELAHYDTLHPTGQPETIGASMRTETQRFVHDAVVDQNGGLRQLLTANYSFVNADLAAIYGLTGSFGAELVKTPLDATQRTGLLTQPGFLASRAGDTAPILRGVFVNQKILCAELPPPPVFEPPMMSGKTRRERVESITGLGTCGESCHARMINPAGFPLENFDNVGKFRTTDQGLPVDAEDAYPFADGPKSYNGPIEWSNTIANSTEAHACYVRHWLEFGFGRAYNDNDAPLVSRVAAASRDTNLNVKQILVQLVQSPSFRTRAVEAP